MFMVYWSALVADEMKPFSKSFDGDKAMVDALACVKEQRDAGSCFVTFVQENPNSVGKPGVDEVVGGMTPDGHAYEWTKKHRGEGPKPLGA